MIIVVLRDRRTERPVPDYIQQLWNAVTDHENKIASLQEQQTRTDDLMVDYQTAAENAERALGLVPQLADKIDALREAIATSDSGSVPQAVQDAADALDTAAQAALTEAQAALADPPSSATDAPPPSDASGPSAPADPGASSPADPAPSDPVTSETPAPGVDPGAPVVSDPNDTTTVPDPGTQPDVPGTGPDGGADANAEPPATDPSTPSPGAPEPDQPSAAAGEGDASVQDPTGANGP